MEQDTRSVDMVDDEINVWELIDHLKTGWRWIVGGGVIGLVSAMGVVFLIPSQYEATAVVQPATVGINTTTAKAVEPIAQTLERLRITTFYDSDVVQSCQADSANKLVKKVKANIVKGNSLLLISYRASTAALAEACTAKVVELLMQSQKAIATPLIKELEEQHALTKQQLDQTERFLAQGEKRISALPVSVASQELFTLLLLKRGDLLELQELYRGQRTQMTAPLTQPLKLLEPIYAPTESVAPRKLIIGFGGLIGGLFIGLLVLFTRLSWRRYKESLPS